MNQTIKVIVSLSLSFLIVPSVALASFWNPFSWGKKQVVPVPVVQVATTTKTVVEKPKEVIKTEAKVKKPDIKTVPKSKPKTTPAPVVAPIDSQVVRTPVIASPVQIATSSEPVAPIVKVSKYMPSIEAIDAFLANPTEQSLREYCTKAKTLIAPGEKKVLNDSRTDYVVKEKPLYEADKLCFKVMEGQLSLNRRQLISWFTYSDSYLASLDNSSESDAVREFKVSFNSYWKSISIYKLIGMTYVEGKGGPVPISESIARISSMLAKDPNHYKSWINRPESYFSFIFPEKILSKLKEDINKQISKDKYLN